ncbi:hypothetical protein [Ferruginibacter profundus]
MSKKTALTYLSIGLIPIFLAYTLCFNYWWVNIEDIHFPTIISVWITWVAANTLGVFISRLAYFKDLGNNYIGLIKLTDTGFLKDSIGKNKAARFKYLSSFFAVLILIVTSIIFYFHTNYFELFQLNKYGLSKQVIVKKISFSNGRRIEFEFDYNQKRYYKVVHSQVYEINDTVPIVFSYVNPDIIKLNK